MEDRIEVRVTVHWDEGSEMGNRLYTLRVNSNGEYVALLKRLASYVYLEERCVEPGPMDTQAALHEKAALEWRLKMLNQIVNEALR